jgi:hypothetical protein
MDKVSLARHVVSIHYINARAYTIKYLLGGISPSCAFPACDSDVRYSSFGFKKYCKDHARLAMSESGSVGGKATSWNKGVTVKEDPRIATLKGESNPFYGKVHTQETREKISSSKRLGLCELQNRFITQGDSFNALTSPEQYTSRQYQYLNFQCNICGVIQQKTLQAYERGSRCYSCNPFGKSNWELQVLEYVKSVCNIDVISGDRSIISPKEIDILIPGLKFGIECHGLYWHSRTENRDAHRHKFKLMNSLGYNLLQIFEDEWRDKRDICQSLISNRLKMNRYRVKTWSTHVRTPPKNVEKAFFESTHISGWCPSKTCFSLYDRDENIVASLSLRIPRQKLKYPNMLEISRYSTALNTTVPGGLSKLLKAAKVYCRENGYTHIMTYVDRRIGSGMGYVSSGFKYIGETGVDYWYTNSTIRENRFKYRATNDMSENEVAGLNGVSKIYGCGSGIYILEIE